MSNHETVKRPYRWKADDFPDTYLCVDADTIFETLETRCAELRVMIGELVAIVEGVEFEDTAPSNDDMNRWHNAALEDTRGLQT